MKSVLEIVYDDITYTEVFSDIVPIINREMMEQFIKDDIFQGKYEEILDKGMSSDDTDEARWDLNKKLDETKGKWLEIY
jgi:hypothetical protein